MQNLTQRKRLSSGLIMLDQKHRIKATACGKSYVITLAMLIIILMI